MADRANHVCTGARTRGAVDERLVARDDADVGADLLGQLARRRNALHPVVIARARQLFPIRRGRTASR
jgi:hypothetical protein